MTDPIVAQKSPYEAEIEAGKKYAWCACGRSASQLFCDGSHKDTGLTPGASPKKQPVAEQARGIFQVPRHRGRPAGHGT